MSKYVSKFRCELCGQRVSRAGFARAAHYRKHVRDGFVVEKERRYESRDRRGRDTSYTSVEFPLTELGTRVAAARRRYKVINLGRKGFIFDVVEDHRATGVESYQDALDRCVDMQDAAVMSEVGVQIKREVKQ
jgi:hypothetical protein